MEVKIMYLVMMFCVTLVTGATLKEIQDVTESTNSDNSTDVKDPVLYFDLMTNQTLNNTASQPWKPDWKVKLPFAGAQCSCENQKCTCCASIRVQAFGFDREACATMNYRPSNNVGLDVTVNNATVFRNTISTRDTKLYCVPMTAYIPVGPLDFCLKLYDISVVEKKLHVCMNMMTRISERPVLLFRFDCMNIDGNGSLKPETDTENRLSENTDTENTDKTNQTIQSNNKLVLGSEETKIIS